MRTDLEANADMVSRLINVNVRVIVSASEALGKLGAKCARGPQTGTLKFHKHEAGRYRSSLFDNRRVQGSHRCMYLSFVNASNC